MKDSKELPDDVDAAPRPSRCYDAVHRRESQVWEAEPELGAGDVSICLPGWIKTFCQKFDEGKGYELSHNAVSALAHTLIAARVRCHRLIEERDEARA